MQITPRGAIARPRREPDLTDPDDLRSIQPEDFGMGAMVSSDSLAVAIQLPPLSIAEASWATGAE